MAIRKPVEDHPAVRISTMVDSLAKILADRGFWRDFTNHIDSLDPLAGSEPSFRENPQALNGRWFYFDVIHTGNPFDQDPSHRELHTDVASRRSARLSSAICPAWYA
jgi:hypothetical protein